MAKRKDKTKCVFDMFHKEKVCDIPKTLGEYIDPMDKLRPKKTAAKDYNLSQTFAIMDKGPVKLRYTDTHGEYEWFPPDYVPPPPKKRHTRGRGPLEELQEEVWAKVVERQQKRIKMANTVKLLEAENARIAAIGKSKAQILKRVGPDWYQELSNYQRYSVDRLALSIILDLKNDSIVCTTQSLLDIGVKCKYSIISFALNNCCASPVEFLLMVYQLINPKRTAYSTTDRLLLSSIAHLSMRDTLKELHIRIPSPPPKEKSVRRPKTEEMRGTCKSPYLDKYLYRAPPIRRKWGRPNKEFPKNEYFSYLQELKQNTIYIYADEEIPDVPKIDYSKISENTDCYTCALIEMELNLVKEWVAAQKVYNKMATSKRVKALYKASVYAACIQETQKDEMTTEEGSEDLPDEEDSEIIIPEENAYTCEESVESISDKTDTCLGDDDCEDKKNKDGSICKKFLVEKMLEIKTRECGCCYCKEMILQMVKNTQCQCEECKEERRRKNTISTPIIFDTTVDNSGKALKIISGMQSKTICTCLEKYLAKWKRHERRTNIKNVQEDLKSLGNKFVIRGMTTGPDGKPIYILEGVKDKDKCPCYNSKKYREEEMRKMELMPKMPDGCIKYVVSGVHTTPEGNVYVIAGTTPNADCQCMNIYNKFIDNHSFCLLLYESYVKKIEVEKGEYFKELSPDYLDFIPKPDSDTELSEDPLLCPCRDDEDASPISCNNIADNDYCTQPDNEMCPCVEKTSEYAEEQTCKIDAYQCEDPPQKCQLAFECDEEQKQSESNGVCQLARYLCEDEEGEEARQEGSNCSSESMYCTCDEDSSDDNRDLERYIILKQFPKDVKEQYKLLKKALAKLAEDGFPLAILPEAYRLPQFRIWLMMRAKKYWTQEDKRAILLEAKLLCNRIDITKDTPSFPGSRFLRDEPEKHNWKYRSLIKKQNEKIRTMFYRDIKRIELNYARMFYPTTYTYEFPSNSFRDVYFCYMPSKEADILAYKVWKSHEYRENNNKQRCTI